MIAARFTNGFSEKSLFRGKQAILGLKMVCPHNFGFAQRIFSKFCTMKGTKRYIEIIVMVFQKRLSFGAGGPFWA